MVYFTVFRSLVRSLPEVTLSPDGNDWRTHFDRDSPTHPIWVKWIQLGKHFGWWISGPLFQEQLLSFKSIDSFQGRAAVDCVKPRRGGQQHCEKYCIPSRNYCQEGNHQTDSLSLFRGAQHLVWTTIFIERLVRASAGRRLLRSARNWIDHVERALPGKSMA